MFNIRKWGNEYCTGTVYSFLWGKVEFEYELSDDRRFRPCWLEQWGGDSVYLNSISLFGRTISLSIWPLS